MGKEIVFVKIAGTWTQNNGGCGVEGDEKGWRFLFLQKSDYASRINFFSEEKLWLSCD